MADPLSVAGLVAGLLSLGLQVSGGITTYIDALDCREAELASAKRQNDTLQTLLQVVNSSLIPLQREQPTVTLAVQHCVDVCSDELKKLGELVAKLAPESPSPSGCGRKRSKWKAHGDKLFYPFSRPKLQQLEEKLRNSNASLQLALQTLGLNLSQKGIQQLATIESTSQALSTELHHVQSEISAIIAPVGGIQTSLVELEGQLANLDVGLDTRFKTLKDGIIDTVVTEVTQQLVSKLQVAIGDPQEITLRTATGRLLSKPSACRDVYNAVNVVNTTSTYRHRLGARPHFPTGSSHTSFEDTGFSSLIEDFACCCPSSRPRQLRNRYSWGPFSVSSESVTEEHVSYCPMAPTVDARRATRSTVRYTGLGRLLNSAVQMTFTMKYGAGGCSISPTFTYRPTVDATIAPQFILVEWLLRIRHDIKLAHLGRDERSHQVFRSVLAMILELFRTGRASVHAVDEKNRNVLYHLSDVTTYSSYDQATTRSLVKMMQSLIKYGVPAGDLDTYGETPASRSLQSQYCTTNAEYLASEMMKFWEPDYLPISKFGPPPKGHRISAAILWSFLTTSQHVAPVYGCGPLSLAVLAGDVARTESILQRHPAAINERNHFGHNPFHLAIANPACLHILTRVADRRALNEVDHNGVLPLEAAVWWSNQSCKLKPLDPEERENSPYYRGKKCHRCHCAHSLVILLNADCGIPTNDRWLMFFQELLNHCSARGRLRFVRAIKNRRQRLKQLALRNLPATDADRLALRRDTVLDVHAREVVRLLEDRGVYIPAALSIAHPVAAWEGKGDSCHIYSLISSANDAQLFFQCGFLDTNIWAMMAPNRPPNWTVPNLPYIRWLHSHGADPAFRIQSFEGGRALTSTHFIFWTIGKAIYGSRPESNFQSLEWAQQLQFPDIADNCQCRCAAEGCTSLIYLLKGLSFPYRVGRSGVRTSDFFLDNMASMTDELLRISSGRFEHRHLMAFLRFATHGMLDLPHTCCDPLDQYCCLPRRCSAEEADEIYQEHMHEFRLLEELLVGFEEDFKTILSSPQGRDGIVRYIRTTWVERVKEALTCLDDDKLSEEERKGAEDIGVVWGPLTSETEQGRFTYEDPPYLDALRQAVINHMETGRLEYDSWCPKPGSGSF
ncbi:hypothetical protein B0J18DRAFT_272944 [Chaetomium sp. MPI-SDFR-AT-0129]|nr:hypothetical protein B0J18DRAFT_272944 [Chaetomium sp. MPI-SDFR-AT-0129]